MYGGYNNEAFDLIQRDARGRGNIRVRSTIKMGKKNSLKKKNRKI